MIASITLPDDKKVSVSAILYSHSDNLFVNNPFMSYIILTKDKSFLGFYS
jgi:hypothetical protein